MSYRFLAALLCANWALASDAQAQGVVHAGDWDFGVLTGTSLGDGEPANDLPIAGHLFVRRRFHTDWAWRAWLEYAKGDFETPAKIVGLVQDPNVDDIDAGQTVWTLGVAAERTLVRFSGGCQLYASLGVAYSALEIDDVSGPLQGGGSFDITTDPGSEWLGTLGLGCRWPFAQRWSFEGLARLDLHVADWEVRDRTSGNQGAIDDYSAYAFLVGLSYSP
jgi:hypothetical protein